jgi:hypothetical protein
MKDRLAVVYFHRVAGFDRDVPPVPGFYVAHRERAVSKAFATYAEAVRALKRMGGTP